MAYGAPCVMKRGAVRREAMTFCGRSRGSLFSFSFPPLLMMLLFFSTREPLYASHSLVACSYLDQNMHTALGT